MWIKIDIYIPLFVIRDNKYLKKDEKKRTSAEALTTMIVIEYIILFIYLILSKQGTIIAVWFVSTIQSVPVTDNVIYP
jgi:hypothetical protein